MQQYKNIHKSKKFNFYLNPLSIVPFLFVIITGPIIQIVYRMHGFPNDYVVSD